MKNIHFLSIIFCTLLLFSCKKNDDYVLVGKPIIKSLAEIRADIKVTSARATNSDGEIYVAGNYLYYIAQKSGVHIFDNTNPASPKNIAFIKLQGVHDIAIKGNYLFADNYSDLVVLNISNLTNVQIVKFVENSIPYNAEYPQGITYLDYPNVDMSDKVICSTCKGAGRIDGLVSQHDDKTENVPCPDCSGRGSYYQMTEQEERDYWEDYW